MIFKKKADCKLSSQAAISAAFYVLSIRDERRQLKKAILVLDIELGFSMDDKIRQPWATRFEGRPGKIGWSAFVFYDQYGDQFIDKHFAFYVKSNSVT